MGLVQTPFRAQKALIPEQDWVRILKLSTFIHGGSFWKKTRSVKMCSFRSDDDRGIWCHMSWVGAWRLEFESHNSGSHSLKLEIGPGGEMYEDGGLERDRNSLKREKDDGSFFIHWKKVNMIYEMETSVEKKLCNLGIKASSSSQIFIISQFGGLKIED